LEAIEFILTATILVLGLAVGLTTLRNAITAELAELSNAILAISQGFTVSGLSGCCSEVQGSATIDIPGLVTPPTCVANFIPSDINVPACP
jgi:hypothetical protein